MNEATFQRLIDNYRAAAVIGIPHSFAEGTVTMALRDAKTVQEYLGAYRRILKPGGSKLARIIGQGLSNHRPVPRHLSDEAACEVCGTTIPAREKSFESGGSTVCRHCTVFMAAALPKAKWVGVIRRGVSGHVRSCLFCATMAEVCRTSGTDAMRWHSARRSRHDKHKS